MAGNAQPAVWVYGDDVSGFNLIGGTVDFKRSLAGNDIIRLGRGFVPHGSVMAVYNNLDHIIISCREIIAGYDGRFVNLETFRLVSFY